MAKKQLSSKQKGTFRPVTADACKLLAFMFLVLYSVGASLMERNMLHLSSVTSQELAATMLDTSGIVVALSFIFRMLAHLIWPIYAFLAVQGFLYTTNLKNYLLRLTLLALVSEIPFDLTMTGHWFDLSTQSGIFSILLGLVGLEIAEVLAEKSRSNAPRFAMAIGCTLWAYLLDAQMGVFVVPAMFLFFYLEDHELFRDLAIVAVCALMVLLTGLDALFATMGAAMILLLLHWYNDRIPMISKWVWYIAYPVHLIILSIISLWVMK